MEVFRKSLSDIFSLLVPKEGRSYYTWREIIIGLVLITSLIFAITLLPR